MSVKLLALEALLFDFVVRGSLYLQLSVLLLRLLRVVLLILAASQLFVIRSLRCTSCAARVVFLVLARFLRLSELVVERFGVFESGMLPLALLVVVLVVLLVALQVLTIVLLVGFVLTDVPVSLLEVVHCDDAKIVTPEERLERLRLI